MGVQVSFSSVRNPRSNSTERVNKEIGKFLRAYCAEHQTGWATLLEEIESTYNSVAHFSHGYAPELVAFGRLPKYSLNKFILGDYELPIDLTVLHERVKKALLKSAEVRTRAFNKNKRLVEYHIGDLVKLRTFPKSDASKKEAAKLF